LQDLILVLQACHLLNATNKLYGKSIYGSIWCLFCTIYVQKLRRQLLWK